MRCSGEPSDAIEITALRVVPDPPEPGKKMTIYAEGSAKQRIDVRGYRSSRQRLHITNNGLLQEGAYADVVVKLGLIKLIQKRFDICQELYVPPELVSPD